MLEVVDLGVRPREDERFVAGVRPAHEVGRTTFLTVHLEDLAIPNRLVDVRRSDDQPVTHYCVHGPSPASRSDRPPVDGLAGRAKSPDDFRLWRCPSGPRDGEAMTDIAMSLLEDTAVEAWAIDDADFPTAGSMSDAIAFCVRYAVLAPSTHNTQPWWFAIDGNTVTVGLDPSRGLAVVDPDDREGTISVGAAVFTLRVALGHFGFRTALSYWPDPHDPEACIRLEVLDEGAADPDLDPLFPAITQRHTNRANFTDEHIPLVLLDALVADARAELADLEIVTDYPSRRALAEIISTADTRQMDDKRFRRELASWMRPAHSRRRDGIRAVGATLTDVMSIAGPMIVRTFDVGQGRAARDVELATRSPALAVLTTATDDRTAWLRAGQALARVVLRATAAGLCVGFLDQPVEVPALRQSVGAAVGTAEQPQLILRLGYGHPAPPQPRRPVTESLVRE